MLFSPYPYALLHGLDLNISHRSHQLRTTLTAKRHAVDLKDISTMAMDSAVKAQDREIFCHDSNQALVARVVFHDSHV